MSDEYVSWMIRICVMSDDLDSDACLRVSASPVNRLSGIPETFVNLPIGVVNKNDVLLAVQVAVGSPEVTGGVHLIQ